MKLKNLEKILFFLTLLFLPTQLGRHFWPQSAFIYSLPVDYLSPVIYFWDILVGFLVMVFLVQKKQINKVALNLFLFFILTQTLSLLSVGVSIGAGLVRLEQYLVAGFFGVYVASQALRDIKSTLFWGLVVAVLGESLLAILQFINSGTLGFWIFGERTFNLSTPGIAKFDFYGREFLRPYGTFPHPNVLAAFLAVTALILLDFKDTVKGLVPKLTYLLAGIVTLLTVSRVVIAVSLVSLVFLLRNKGRLLIIILILLLSPILYTRYASLLNFDNLALTRREELLLTALSLWQESPTLGKGLNNFIPKGADLLLAGPSRFLQPVHNIFLLSLSETGVIGLMGLFVLIGYPIFRRRKFLFVWGVILFLGLFDHYFLTLPQGYRLLFLVWGLSLAVLK